MWWIHVNPLVTGLWIGFGCLICFGLIQTLPKRRSRPAIVAAIAVIYFTLPITWQWGVRAYAEGRQQRQACISAKCKQTMDAAISSSASKPISVDGFLDMTNQDALMNDRLGRAVDKERLRVGSAETITLSTGSYQRHPYTDLYKGGAFGSSFNGMARRILIDKRFSYAEFVLLPERFSDEYANAGTLTTGGWSGVKYRRYYLAPSDHINCVGEVGDGRWGRQIILRAYAGGVIPDQPAKPYCLALEVTSESISAYTITASEEQKIFWTILYPRGIPFPTWTSVRLNAITIRDRKTGEVVSRFEGFDYPDEISASHRCNNYSAVPRFLEASFSPDEKRTFLRGMKWYAGSGVQRHYEP